MPTRYQPALLLITCLALTLSLALAMHPLPASHAQDPTPLPNDFTPPVGADLDSPAESPGRFRLWTATSPDGLTFTPTGQVILDQANVPDMVMDEDGRIYLYFTGWQMGDQRNITAAALSDDMGQTWAFRYLTLEGFPGTQPTGDPDILLLPDGTFRLLLTTEVERGVVGVVYAEGTDGLTFTYQGVAFRYPKGSSMDSTTFSLNDTWHLYILEPTSINPLYATSADGLTFDFEEQTTAFKGYVASNGYAIEGGYRMVGFSIPNHDFRSFVTSDGRTWTQEDGVVMAYDPALGGDYIKDPTILALPDGTYLMVYVTRITGA